MIQNDSTHMDRKDWANHRARAGGASDVPIRALVGVLRGAQEGELPLFTWTLGLPQDELMDILLESFPEVGPLEPLLTPHYARLLGLVPDHFAALVRLLEAYHQPAMQDGHTHWLPRVVAAACYGEHHLWEDLGLADREQLRTLFLTEFPALGLRNTQGLRWKRFLFKELGRQLGQPDLLPPGCLHCESRDACHRD